MARDSGTTQRGEQRSKKLIFWRTSFLMAIFGVLTFLALGW